MKSCERIGCNKKFSEDESTEGECQFHPGPPVFHDGKKEWNCCKKWSHDFNLFLSIPGCRFGRHSSEKPKPESTSKTVLPETTSATLPTNFQNDEKSNCLRCSRGYFCSDHNQGTESPPSLEQAKHKYTVPERAENVTAATPKVKILNLHAKQVCGNKGCGLVFTELQNHDAACNYHPGPAIFHDRLKGWECCGVHTKDFDEFLEIPPCTKGWHKANC